MPEALHDPLGDAGALRRVVEQFKAELRDFAGFVRRPSLQRRLPRAAVPVWQAELTSGITPARVACWLLATWAVTLLLLGPLAAMVAQAAGTGRRFSLLEVSWFRVALWAPFIEEILLRFGLRQPALAMWLIPLAVVALLAVATPPSALMAGCVLIATGYLVHVAGYRWPRERLRHYADIFPFVFHLVAICFAALHLANFKLGATPGYLWPLLILPQWLAGLVLGWMRVRFGVGLSVLMHGLYNAGPFALLLVLDRYASGWLYQ